MPTIVSRLISLPVFAFLSLTALLFLFSSALSHLSIPRSMAESGKAIAAVENATLVDRHAIESSPEPAGVKVSLGDLRVDSSGEAPLDKAIWKLHVVPSDPRDQVHSRFNGTMVYGNRRPTNPANRRSHSHPTGFFLGLAHQFGVFMWRLQTISVPGRVAEKESLVTQTHGRPRKEMRINQRRISRPARSALLRALARKGREFALR
jgi:hypothetical protein